MGNTVKLAVKKEPGSVPGGGFHYMLHPIVMVNDLDTKIYSQIGYIIIEVEEEKANRLIASAARAIHHQLEVAILVERELKK